MSTDSPGQARVRARRKTGFGTDGRRPGVEREGEQWHLRSYAAVRQVLRDSERVRQGVSTDNPLLRRLRPSVIFQDGEAHREQRSAIARFFAPRTVERDHEVVIDELTTRLVERLGRDGRADLSELSMELAVEVAARVVGLSDSAREGMDRRIDRLLGGEAVFSESGAGLRARLQRGAVAARAAARMGRFHLLDVRPAIAARRVRPRADVISHLLGKGYNSMEILVECLTYATAGMVTTREFIGVAAWHMLENPGIRAEYLAGDQDERRRILHELLRVEPVASTLWRRAQQDLRIEDGGVTHRIPAGSRMVLDIRTANADPAAVGQDPLTVDPHRFLAAGVQPQALAFGDGPHKCPGSFLAIHESDLFLRKLLAMPIRLTGDPRLTYNEMLASYEIRGLTVEVDTG